MQRYIVATLAAVLALFVIACTPEQGGSDGKSQPGQHGGPAQAQPAQPMPADPNVNNPGPVQGDPSAHDPTPASIELKALWYSETKALPTIEYSIGGAQITAPANSMHVQRVKGGLHDGQYTGTWIFETQARSGTTYGFTLFGTASTVVAACQIVHHAQLLSPQTSTRNCASSYTVP